MSTSVNEMIETASAAVPKITPAEAMQMMTRESVLLLDVREAPEIEKSGKIEGALHVSRGMLELRADPQSPYFDKTFDKARPILVYCASGQRSALGGKTLMDLGYEKVFNLGAFKDWVESGGPIERPIEPGM